MAEFARVVTFDADDAALDALLGEVNSMEQPEGLNATRITILADRAGGRVIVATRFASDEDRRKGGEILEAMSPPSVGSMRRVSVDQYEVMLERNA